MDTIDEGKAKINVKLAENTVSRQMEVFYNPVMKHNRDLAIAFTNSYKKLYDWNLRSFMFPMAGTGIRAIRFLKECIHDKSVLRINDMSEDAIFQIKSNLKLNDLDFNSETGSSIKAEHDKVSSNDDELVVEIHNKDANTLMCEKRGFDYVDLDPYGSPNIFLNNAIAGVARKGVLAVTATDTAPLCGTYPVACKRYYDSISTRGYLKYEAGIRILIRRVQTIASTMDKMMIPLVSYAKDHYFRVYFRCIKGRSICDKELEKHGFVLFNNKTGEYEFGLKNFDPKNPSLELIGPLHLGQINDPTIIEKMIEELPEDKFLQNLLIESKYERPFGYDLHALSRMYKLQDSPSKKGLDSSTFGKYSVKSDLVPKEFISKHVLKN